jgi:hypothetical protein
MAVRNNKTRIVRLQPIVTIGSNLNWSTNGVVFSDNRIVRGANLYSKEAENKLNEEYSNNRYLQLVNLADSYIKDELAENDDRALEMLNEAYSNSTEMAIRIIAKLNTFLYYLSKDNIKNAEEALSVATQLPNEFAGIDPSFRRVIDIEAPSMLRIYKNATN